MPVVTALCCDQMWHPVAMVQPRSIILFMSGVGFALAVVLSCNSRGHVSADANVADASPPDVAGSEACCSSITVSGVTKMVSAENDASQLRSAVVPVSTGHGPLLSGPIVLTNITQQITVTTGSGIVTTDLYLSAGSCDSEDQIFFSLPASTGSTGFSGRLWIPAGMTLCHALISSIGGVASGFLLYSGFVPY